MTMQSSLPFRFALPLPSFVMHRYTAILIAVIHIYLSFGHLLKLFGGDLEWTHIWKGFGSLAGAYIFAALASHGFARNKNQLSSLGVVVSPKTTDLPIE